MIKLETIEEFYEVIKNLNLEWELSTDKFNPERMIIHTKDNQENCPYLALPDQYVCGDYTNQIFAAADDSPYQNPQVRDKLLEATGLK